MAGPYHVPLGRDLAAARKRAGLDQAAFAERVGVTQSTLSLWENSYTDPSREHREAIRETLVDLGVDIDEN